ncbi:nudix hydrolase 2 [Beta vulgaris subsp. vulgaris]|uniref:nudix hydrolase 2 n=1 Tax=Beta vulgaris subsp. vulgaris TaxID=3555 RepID=UPI0005401562|nr:nudix hydrolase 2 [Beta vulgaris subsp. vulgaris]
MSIDGLKFLPLIFFSPFLCLLALAKLKKIIGSRQTPTRHQFISSFSRSSQVSDRLLPAREDEHGGLIVDIQEPMNSYHFASSLRSSLSYWRQLGKRGVWIKLPIQHYNLIEAAVKEGFNYHHAEARYLMLTKWLPLDEPSALPANASHRVSVGALVVNHKKEVLVVQEKNGMLRGKGVWKFPTGTINEGEDICAAAVREVKEETGIETKFVEMLTFREHHMAFFQKSDLFFVCLLQPLSFNIQVQESEIEAAQWMPFQEYAAQPFVKKYELLRNMVKICKASIKGQYSGFPAVAIKPSFRDGRDCIYFNNQASK